ncbi:IS200/IS605 family transposase [Arcicella sp. DC2W]|uniref:IS200/IS605 family transposase n=1 Tax=Arcicella gelida TaxID=2984195 RepID=A0ABU5RZZ4_9BACT|nr:IS200/IS605 family transposase [Arcicella sp. DC2W]MEA5401750.1 IS200/IS605 family transposase [Arcicella sp. DC2W]
MTGNLIYLYVHAVWTTKHREPCLNKSLRYQLLEHIRNHAKKKDIQLEIINGVEDHLHCLFKMKSTQSIAEIIKNVKGESSRWINESGLLNSHFQWQDGYGVFSVSPQNVGKVKRYIFNQESHHKVKKIDEELLEMVNLLAE